MIIHADCLDAMRAMEAESVDAVVTDPPAGIAFMGKHWDGDKGGRSQWIAWLAERMAEALRVLKPGHCAFVWALPRTSHWTATALEDAGFEVRDIITHVQGQGFPKSKALLKPSAEHWILCRKPGPLRHLRIDECRVGTEVRTNPSGVLGTNAYGKMTRNETFTVAAGRWPANFALSHGPECKRVGTKRIKGIKIGHRGEGGMWGSMAPDKQGGHDYCAADGTEEAWGCAPGCPVAMLDEQSGVRTTHAGTARSRHGSGMFGIETQRGRVLSHGDTGTASRFFHCFPPDPFIYQAKASRKDRGEGNRHPTVKSVALMRHLVRLITPPGGLVLDPFAGSGSTGVACQQEGLRFVGIEQDVESVATARGRLGAEMAPAQLELGAA